MKKIIVALIIALTGITCFAKQYIWMPTDKQKGSHAPMMIRLNCESLIKDGYTIEHIFYPDDYNYFIIYSDNK